MRRRYVSEDLHHRNVQVHDCPSRKLSVSLRTVVRTEIYAPQDCYWKKVPHRMVLISYRHDSTL